MKYHFLFGRVGGSIPIVFSYVSEFFTEKQRGPVVILLTSCWQPGIIFTALLAWLLLGSHEAQGSVSFYIGSLHFVTWRLFIILCTIPSFLSAASLVFLPESPGFLFHVRLGHYSSLVCVHVCVHALCKYMYVC